MVTTNQKDDEKEESNKKRFPLISYFFGAFGVLWIIISFFQWMIWYPDLSQFIFGISVGLGLLFVAYDHWWKIKTEKRNKAESERIDKEIKELNEACDRILDYSRTEIEKLNSNNNNLEKGNK